MGRLTDAVGGRKRQIGGQAALTGQQTSILGIMINQSITAMNVNIGIYSNASQQIVSGVLARADSNAAYNFLQNEIVVSKTVDFSTAAQVANDIITTQFNILNFSNYIVQKASDPNNLTNSNSASSNLQALYVTSNAIVLTSNINYYSNCVVQYNGFVNQINAEKQGIQATITSNTDNFYQRAGDDLLYIYTLKQRVTADYTTLKAFPVVQQGPNFPNILTIFQDAQFRLQNNFQSVTQTSNTYSSQISSMPETYLTDMLAIVRYQTSNLNKLLIAEYDVSSVNIQTRGVITNLQANQDLNMASLKINTINTQYLSTSFDISGWFFNTMDDLSANVMSNINNMSRLMNPLDSQSILVYANQMNSILGNLATTLNLENNLNSNFTNMIWYDTADMLRAKLTSNTATSNIVVQSNAIITSNLSILKESFNTTYENLRATLLSNIKDQYSQFTSNFTFVKKSLEYINENSAAAYLTMASSNYSGKYSYYYDYIGAMLGKNSNILQQAMTSNFPRDVLAPNPIMYDSNTLYDANGNIILASIMYPYISDRYLASNYDILSNQFMTTYNTPTPTPDASRSNITKLQGYNMNFAVDVTQLSNYSNTIASDPNLATNPGLKSYIGNFQNALTNGNDPGVKAQIVGDITNLYENIKKIATQIMTLVERTLLQTQTDIYFFQDDDFSNISKLRGSLKNYYIQADFIVNNNGQYFQETFQNSNGQTGSYFFVYDLPLVKILGLYMSNDYTTLSNIMSISDLTGISDNFQSATSNAIIGVQSNIGNILSNTAIVYEDALNMTNFVINMINTDVPQLLAFHLDGPCFDYYPTVIGASNQLDTILTVSLPALALQLSTASNTYLTITNLKEINNMSESLLYTSNNIYNNYLTASNFSNNLQGKTDDLLTTFSNTYSNLAPEIVFKLPLFTGENCSSTSGAP